MSWSVPLAAACVAACTGCSRSPAPAAGIADLGAASQRLMLGGSSEQPEAVVSLSLDRGSMSLAERLTLRLTIQTSADRTASWTPPLPPDERLGDFQVAGRTERRINPASSADRPVPQTIVEHTLVLEPFLSGTKTIPPIHIQIAGGDRTQELVTQPVSVEVSAVLPPDEAEKAELSADRPLASLDVLPPRGSVPLAALAGIAACAWLGAFVMARASAGRVRAASDPVAAARLALAEVGAAIRATQADPFAPGSASTRDDAARLAATVRTYLQDHLGVQARGATAAELGGRIASSAAIPADQAERTRASLMELEQAEFSPVQPRAAVVLDHLAAAEALVAATASRIPTAGTGRVVA